MIIVDTNVFSALMVLEQEPAVRGWLNRQAIDNLRVTAPTIFEVHHGISRLPAGRRRRELDARLTDVMLELFVNNVLPLAGSAAALAGRVHSEHISKGRNVDVPDSQIAGIAQSMSAAIATRNKKDFIGLGIPLTNPWE